MNVLQSIQRRVCLARRLPRAAIAVGGMMFAVLLALTGFSRAAGSGAYSGTSVVNPVSSATTPLSSHQSGLVSKPNPVDTGGNLVVTGNVGAGKHFRGNIPYRSTTSMNTPLGSTSLDSFLRYTAATETSAASAGTYTPYYSSSRTAATLSPGTRSVFAPVTNGAGTGELSFAPAGSFLRSTDTTGEKLYPNSTFRILSPEPKESATDDGSPTTTPRLQLWPLSQSPETAEGGPAGNRGWTTLRANPDSSRRADTTTDETMSRYFGFETETTGPKQNETLTGEDYRKQMEALQRRLGQVNSDVTRLEQSLAVRNDPSAPAVADPRGGLGRDLRPVTSESLRRERLLQETARLLATTTGLPGTGDSPFAPAVGQEDAALGDTETEAASETQIGSRQRLRLYDPSEALASTEEMRSSPGVKTSSSGGLGLAPTGSAYDFRGSAGADTSRRTPVAPMPHTERAGSFADSDAAARRVDPETPVVQPSVQSPLEKVDPALAASSQKEFTRRLQQAGRYLQRQAYRQAADAYALAIAYRPTDARAHLGRSQALLAAAQYDASAMSLAKAMELESQVVLKKTDLVKLVGGPEAFVARFHDLDQAVQSGEAPMLRFLVAYLCYQMDRPEEARTAIEAAHSLLPSSIAIDRLKTAIYR